MYGILIYMPDGERGMTYENDNAKATVSSILLVMMVAVCFTGCGSKSGGDEGYTAKNTEFVIGATGTSVQATCFLIRYFCFRRAHSLLLSRLMLTAV